MLKEDKEFENQIRGLAPKFDKLCKDMVGLKHLKVMTITWNMGAVVPTLEQLDALLQKDVVQHDMYVIAS